MSKVWPEPYGFPRGCCKTRNPSHYESSAEAEARFGASRTGPFPHVWMELGSGRPARGRPLEWERTCPTPSPKAVNNVGLFSAALLTFWQPPVKSILLLWSRRTMWLNSLLKAALPPTVWPFSGRLGTDFQAHCPPRCNFSLPLHSHLLHFDFSSHIHLVCNPHNAVANLFLHRYFKKTVRTLYIF